MTNKNKPTVVLCIMDGWGINKNSEHNAIAIANTPNVDYLTNGISISEFRKFTCHS